MNLSRPQLDRIATYGKALTPIADVAILMRLDEDELMDEMVIKTSPVRLAYETARAQTEYDIRSAEINLAINGSPMAVQHVKQYIDDLSLQNE